MPPSLANHRTGRSVRRDSSELPIERKRIVGDRRDLGSMCDESLPTSGYGHACGAAPSTDLAARPGQQALACAWAQFWAHSSTYGAVHRWSPRSCSRGSRTVADAGERHATLLESVLGATPQEFESPILRHL